MNNVLSVDLGTQNDYTAISLLTRAQRFMVKESLPGTHEYNAENPDIINEIQLKFLERMPLKTSYPEVITRVGNILNNPQLIGDCFLVVDATGVGLPVLQMMREEMLSPVGITITGGHTVAATGNGYNVPKRDIVGSLQTALESGRLKIAKGLPHSKDLIKEMQNFKVKISKSGNDTYEAWRESIHDDIVMSVAQGIWFMNKIHGTRSISAAGKIDKYDPLNF